MSGPANVPHPAQREQHAVDGWASRVDVRPGAAPAVVVNPGASDGALLAWALGQIEQLNALLEPVATGAIDGGMPSAALAGAVQHFNEQARAVLAVLAGRIGDAAPPPST